jgi:2-keto-4-pentenoate hydratase/2-oxohepta-3-ene-1,7-dioic acid hydratase in catechol pathway
VSAEDARHLVAGYTLVNDVTARDIQRGDMADSNPWFRSKSVDTFCPLGPVVVMAEVLDWPVVTPLETRVNGAVRQSSTTDRFIFSIAEVIAAITRFMTLEPGDLIAMGTPEGVGPLTDGDVVEVENPAIGVLRNPVRAVQSA